MGRYLTLTVCGPTSQAIEMPDFLVEPRHLPPNGAAFSVPAVASKWAAGEIRLKADQARGTISVWTMPSVRIGGFGLNTYMDCLPATLTHAPTTVTAWVNVATGMPTYAVLEYDPSLGWATQTEAFWLASGLRRPLGHGRWVQVELDDSPEINAYAARSRGMRMPSVRMPSGSADACANPACAVTPSAAELKRCSACREASYCSRACQVQHWPVHKGACRRRPPKPNAALW